MATGGGFWAEPFQDDRKRMRKLRDERRELRRMIMELIDGPQEGPSPRIAAAPATESGLTAAEERRIERARAVAETEVLRLKLEVVQTQILAIQQRERLRKRSEDDELLEILAMVL